jgi:hypothetical protein
MVPSFTHAVLSENVLEFADESVGPLRDRIVDGVGFVDGGTACEERAHGAFLAEGKADASVVRKVPLDAGEYLAVLGIFERAIVRTAPAPLGAVCIGAGLH